MPSSTSAAVALAVLVSLGSAMDASASDALRPAGADAATIQASERRAVVSWLGRLAESTRKFHGQSHDLTAFHTRYFINLASAPAIILDDRSDSTSWQALVLTHHRLIDLPPPALSLR